MPSERKSEKPNQLAEEIEITNNILDGLRAIDKDILAGVPMKAALDGVCRSMVEIFSLKLCWVGLLQEGTFEVRPTAFWGSEEGYLSAIQVAYDDTEYGKGPSGTAIKTRRPVIRNDIEGEAVSTPWREEALKRGYRSSAAFSLIYEGRVVGVLNVYAAEPCYFDRGLVKLIQTFADQTAILISAAQRLEALRKSEARYRGLVEAATDAVVSADGDGKIVLWNPAAALLFGYSEREALGKDLTIIIPERYRGQAIKAFGEAKRTGGLRRGAGHAVEAEGLRKDGTTFPLEHSISIEETPMGTCFTTIIRDITERKRAENELRLLATVVQDSNDAIIVRDLSNKILTWNPAAERLYGYKQGEMIGRDFSAIIPEEQVERATSFLKRVIAGEKLFQIDIRRLCKNGQILDVSVTASPLRDKDGNVMAVATTEMDITERKKMEVELRESEKLYHTLFDNAPVGLGIADADGNLIAYNDAMLKSGGYTREDMARIGNVAYLYYDPDGRAKALALAQRQGFLYQHEVRFKRKDDTYYEALLSLARVTVKRRECWQAVVEDITERKRVEKALQESERKFKDLAEKSPIGTYLIQDGVFVYVNPRFAEIFRYTIDEVVEKKGPRELVLPEDWPIVEENIRKRISGEIESVHYDFRGIRKDKGIIHVEVSGSRTEYQGRPAIIGTLVDITERKYAEDEIKRLKEFNEEIVQRMDDGIMTLDKDYRITFLNPKALEMLGYAKGELKGEPYDVVCCCNREEVQAQLDRVRERHSVKFECILRTKDGRELTVLNSCTPIVHGDRFDGFLSTLTDITEWKFVEEAFIEKNLKYDITKGNLYLSEEASMERAMDSFLDLLKAKYKGMVITRRHTEEVRERYQLKDDVPIYWLGTEASPGVSAIPPEFPVIEREVRDFLGSRKAVLLDRLEYIVSQKGFDETMAFVQRIHEFAYAKNGIVLLSLDPATLPPHQLALLRSETLGLERREGPAIPEDLQEILQFVHQENREGRRPTPKELTKRFGFSRMTCLTRLKKLKALGLLAEEQRGRTRPVLVTEKGKEYL